MSTEQVQGLLQKLGKSLNRFNGNGQGKKDWKAINEEKKRKIFKPSPGKNQIMVITPSFASDPFTEWGYHANLQEVSYYTVPCDAHNKGEECVVCKVVDTLKKADFEKNKNLWLPIEQKKEFWAPIINLDSEATIAEGPKWMRFSKTIMNQLFKWLSNLEDGELPFYSDENFERIIIEYDPNSAPATQYTLEKKPLRKEFSTQQIKEWADSIKPISEFIFTKSQEDIKKLVDEYLIRVSEVLDESIEDNKGEIQDKIGAAEEASTTSASSSKLAKFKKPN